MPDQEIRGLLYEQIVRVLNSRAGQWVSQEYVSGIVKTSPKIAQATLSALFSASFVERIPRRMVERYIGKKQGTVGRWLYRVRIPLDVDYVSTGERKRITSRRRSSRQMDLGL